MPEFRQNLATKEWVIVSPGRKQRPSDFAAKPEQKSEIPTYSHTCPFCPGNEDQTTAPVYIWPDDNDWQVRVVPNKYAALDPDLDASRHQNGLFLKASGFGIAEVIVEHPRHDYTLGKMDVDDVAEVLRAYRSRQIVISDNPKVNLVTIFRNHGPRAGTSLLHPHSQIIATPLVPPHVRYPIEQAVRHYDRYGTCVYCDMLFEEIRQGDRVIIETERFVAFCPFAARSPFEVRIYPKRHVASFVWTSDAELDEMAAVLSEVLGRLHWSLHNPDYNFIIRSAPIGDENTRYLHWYMVIIPKISTPAGFEIGSGIYINSVAPEDCADFLRKAPSS